MQEVLNILQLDSYVRTILQQNQQGKEYYDILTLENIDFTKNWDYSLPTIYANSVTQLFNDRIKDVTTFKERFKNTYDDYFSQVDFNNILIAGGAVMKTLLRKDWNNDVDIFIYGLSEEQAINKLTLLISQIYKSYSLSKELEQEETKDYIEVSSSKSRGPDIGEHIRHLKATKNSKKQKAEIEVITVRNKNALSLQFDDLQEIQIILRLYSSVSEILHGFDLGSVAVGYDGERVYFTSLGKFSYENLVNIVDPTRRSTTYEYRLKKYLDRGFQIILPYLDISKLKTSNLKYNIMEVASLPYFTFSYSNVKNNVITMAKLLKYGNSKTIRLENCDYGNLHIEEYSIFYKNLKSLVHGERNYGYYHYSAHMDKDILTSPPYILSSQIIDYYDKLEQRIYNKGAFNIHIFSSYFSVDLLPQVLTDIFLNNTGTSKLGELIEKQKMVVLERLASLTSEDYKLRFLTKDPGTQLSGSFNPILSNYRDWYGEYLLQ